MPQARRGVGAPKRSTRRARRALDLIASKGASLLSHVTIDVTSLGDSGPGTLRAAIIEADGGLATDNYRIDFKVTGTIDLETALPDLANTTRYRWPGDRAS